MRSSALLAWPLVVACATRPSLAPSEPARAAPCPEAPAPRAAAPTPAATDADAVAARVIELINARDAQALFALFDPEMQRAVPLETLAPFVAQVSERRGQLRSVEREDAEQRKREGRFRVRAAKADAVLRLSLAADGRISGLFITSPPPADPQVVRSSIGLRLPVRGRWLVFWGGDRPELNRHLDANSQRRAADLVIVDAAGKSHRTDGKTNQDYYAWGKEVLAVADGTVTQVVDGVPENQPGTMNRYFVPGNAVVIEHAPELFSVYAHLQPGKLSIRRGARVKQGAMIGLCGNSGNSSEPHLHFQLQDGPLLENSWGVEAVFGGVLVTRAGSTSKANDYSFLKGDLIETSP